MELLYIITNGRNYLSIDSNQQITTVAKRDKAKRFTYDKAKNVLANLNRRLKNLGYYMELDEEANQFIEQASNGANQEINAILSQVQEFESYIQDIGKKRDALSYELSRVDAEIEDILHAAEFYSLNACEGYKLYKMLRDSRIRRRKLKDYIEVVGYIEGATGKELAEGKGSKSILGKMSREYKPRVLNELFNR